MQLSDIYDIAFAGDWHGNTRWATYCIEQLGEAGVRTVIHVGDFGYQFDRGYVQALESALGRMGMRLYFLRGNHDSTEVLRSLPKRADGSFALSERMSFMADGFRFTIGGYEVLVLGGAGSIDRAARLPGIEWWDDERLGSGSCG